MTDQLPDRPPLRLTVGDQQIKMTYGLEMDLRRLLPDPVSALSAVMNDPFIQDYVIKRCLSPSKKMISDFKDLDNIEVELDADDTERLLMWAVDHILYFFAMRASSIEKAMARYPGIRPNPSNDGSESSASTTPSAGPSE